MKNGEKPLSVAIDELNQAKIKVVAQEEPKELEAQDMQEEPDILKEAVE